jgi:hypothetical protein
VPIVLALAVLAGGALAFAGCVPGSAAGGARTQTCSITGRAFADFSGEARPVAFYAARVPLSGEVFLRFSEESFSRRFLREKSAASALPDQGFSAAPDVSPGVSSKCGSAFPFVRCFTDLIAVRK